jgi:hypothetical protein
MVMIVVVESVVIDLADEQLHLLTTDLLSVTN